MTEAEAREIVKNAMSKSYIEARLWEAKGFLAGIAHERARAERLVRALENIYRIKRDDKVHAKIELACVIAGEALSAYNQERGEKEGK